MEKNKSRAWKIGMDICWYLKCNILKVLEGVEFFDCFFAYIFVKIQKIYKLQN